MWRLSVKHLAYVGEHAPAHVLGPTPCRKTAVVQLHWSNQAITVLPTGILVHTLLQWPCTALGIQACTLSVLQC